MATGQIFMEEEPIRYELWVPVTIRIAWELSLLGIPTSKELLENAREHILRSIPSNYTVEEAERFAIIYTHDFMDRLNIQRYARPEADDDLRMHIPQEWRMRIEKNASSLGRSVFRYHYRDGFSLEEIAAKLGVSVQKVQRSKKKLHVLIRKVVLFSHETKPDTLKEEISSWSPERIDRLLGRVAIVAELEDFDFQNILSMEGRVHMGCPRVYHAYRLLQEGAISLNDLKQPEEDMLTSETIKLLALVLHPDGRRHGRLLDKELQDFAISAQGNVWLIAAEDIPEVQDILIALAEENRPPRHHLRGALVHGSGAWFDDLLLGPLAVRAIEAARARPWGEIDGMDTLPAPLPPPKKAVKTWVLAVLSFAMSAFLLHWSFANDEYIPRYPIEAVSHSDQQTVRIRFDVSDDALIHIIQYSNGEFEVLHQNLRREKGVLATGDGRYFYQATADRLIVVSSDLKIEDWGEIFAVAQSAENPFGRLKEVVLRRYPRSFIQFSSLRKTLKDDSFTAYFGSFSAMD
ncbi:MAG: hypothetical protein VX278_11920 [Myxococcota bacterium]|nr:hypothetical protein [Myxococcota bacterium]